MVLRAFFLNSNKSVKPHGKLGLHHVVDAMAYAFHFVKFNITA